MRTHLQPDMSQSFVNSQALIDFHLQKTIDKLYC